MTVEERPGRAVTPLVPAARHRVPPGRPVPRPGEEPGGGRQGAAQAPAPRFHDVLLRACQGGDDGPVVAAEAVRRAEGDVLSAAGIRVLLLVAPPGPVWSAARAAALAAVARVPELAPRVLSEHAQAGRLPSVVVREGRAEPAGEAPFAAEAGLTGTTGSIQAARSRRAARHLAMVSLLARLADLPDPVVPAAVITVRWDEAPPGAAGSVTDAAAPGEPARDAARGGHAAPAAPVPAAVEGPATPWLAEGVPVTAEDDPPPVAGACAEEAFAAAALVAAAVRGGAAAVFLPARHPAAGRIMLYAPDGDGPPPVVAVTGPPAPVRTAAGAEPPGRADGRNRPGPASGPAPAGSPPRPLAGVVRDLVLPGPVGAPPRRARVAGWAVPVPMALPALLAAGPGAHPSVRGWAAVTRAALRLVARGRVHPALTWEGRDCWRAGPLTGRERRELADLAADLPPSAYCLLTGAAPLRIPAPEGMARAFADAVAEAMVRTPGAGAVLGPVPYAGPPGEPSPAVCAWADTVEDRLDPRPVPGLVLRVRVPEDPDGSADPALPAVLHLVVPPRDGVVADAARGETSGETGGGADELVAGETGGGGDGRASGETGGGGDGRAGGEEGRGPTVAAVTVWEGNSPHPQLTAELLPGTRRALRRAARVFPPLAALASQARPGRLALRGEDCAGLLGEPGRRLEAAGVRVVWPAALVGAITSHTVVGGRGPAARKGAANGATASAGGFSLAELVDFRWQFAVDGVALTDAEMDALAEAARPLVRLRDRWLLVDPVTAARARDRILRPLPAHEALAAALSGSATVGGLPVTCVAAGALGDLVARLRDAPAAPVPVPLPAGLTARLRDYQARALTWLAHTTGMGFGALLADDMGLGKTVTTIALHRHRAEQGAGGPSLVVCPASLMANWEREFARFSPATMVRRFHGPGRDLGEPAGDTVVVTTYGTVRRDAGSLERVPWGLVVADEAQHVKNHAAATSAALRRVRGEAVVAVTGTPVENNLGELWSILDWINPGLFGTQAAFRARYGEVERDPASPAGERLARLVAPFMMRRRKGDPDIAPELPAKVHHERIVALTAEQAGLYEAMVRETLERIAASTGIARSGLVLTLLQGLRQICDAPALFLREPPDLAAADPDAAAARSGKLRALEELLARTTARGEAALIFTGYVAMGRLLQAQLIARGHRPYFLHGQTPPARRQEMVDAFQRDPVAAPVFILSVRAAGTGLNLTRAEHVIHYDRPWNPAVEDQATDRAHRIGQRRTVNVHQLITEGTVEDRITALLRRKRALGEAVLASGEGALGRLDDGELAALVTLGGAA